MARQCLYHTSDTTEEKLVVNRAKSKWDIFIYSLHLCQWGGFMGLYEIIGTFFFFVAINKVYILAIEGHHWRQWRQRPGLESMHLERQVHISFFFLFSTKSTSTHMEHCHLTLHTIIIWTTIAQPICLQWMGRITKMDDEVTQNMYNLL